MAYSGLKKQDTSFDGQVQSFMKLRSLGCTGILRSVRSKFKISFFLQQYLIDIWPKSIVLITSKLERVFIVNIQYNDNKYKFSLMLLVIKKQLIKTIMLSLSYLPLKLRLVTHRSLIYLIDESHVHKNELMIYYVL